MEFFPLTLGVPKPRPPRERGAPDGGPDRPSRWDEAAWREGLSLPHEPVEEIPAAAVLDRLIRTGAPVRPWVILGETGAGKSRLLEHWHETWLRRLPGEGAPRLGQAVPALVRLGKLELGTLDGDPEAVADRLWERGVSARVLAANSRWAALPGGLLPARLFSPVWLLDGLDELPGDPADPALWEALGALPGGVVLSCRTAVFQAARREAGRWVAAEYQLLGLKPEGEQSAYLATAMAAVGLDPSQAQTIVARLNANPALRPLAANPLLLGLAAEASEDLVLPDNRAGFYGRASENMWRHKLRDWPDMMALGAERDCVLAALATRMGLEAGEAPQAALASVGSTPVLDEALRRSGLLRFDDRRYRIAFPHLTFQEYHLARAWLERPFREALEAHWAEPRHEEALALLVALHWEEGRGPEIEGALRQFTEDWRERHARDRSVLWGHRRSPYVVALTLLGRAGVEPGDPFLGADMSDWRVKNAVVSMKWLSAGAMAFFAGLSSWHPTAIAWNPSAPPRLLGQLAVDWRRETVSKNPSAPPELLERLSWDAEESVRKNVAMNPSAPLAALERLAGDSNPIRAAVARNPSTPFPLLERLAFPLLERFAGDLDYRVQQSVARNPSTPVLLIERLAQVQEPLVRAETAGHPAITPGLLTKLADDDDPGVREMVARQRSAPPRLLANLAADKHYRIRERVAQNPMAPLELLERLARERIAWSNEQRAARDRSPERTQIVVHDVDFAAREVVAGNPSMPSSLLDLLADDIEPLVRGAVAANPSTSSATLERLAEDETAFVRKIVAESKTAADKLLERLAGDRDEGVREKVATNPAAPQAGLDLLADDDECRSVRSNVARNELTPSYVLARLAADADGALASLASGNPSLLPEDLWLPWTMPPIPGVSN